MYRRLISVLVLVAVVVGVTGLTACGGEENAQLDQQRQASITSRASTFSRAEHLAPVPRTVNFPLRKALVEFTERQDLIDHPWYIYILGMNGNTIGYYVGKTVPINACNFLSSTEEVDWNEGAGGVVLTAPSLDGIFYGGGGASAGCDSWFFFDAATNALIQIRGVNYFTADQPLNLNAKAIKVTK